VFAGGLALGIRTALSMEDGCAACLFLTGCLIVMIVWLFGGMFATTMAATIGGARGIGRPGIQRLVGISPGLLVLLAVILGMNGIVFWAGPLLWAGVCMIYVNGVLLLPPTTKYDKSILYAVSFLGAISQIVVSVMELNPVAGFIIPSIVCGISGLIIYGVMKSVGIKELDLFGV
jgi:hypothetical protein